MIEDAKGRTVARLSEFLGSQTNNYAEYAGLLGVLRWAAENNVKRLRLVSDSELMVKQMKGLFRVKNPGLIPLWQEAKRLSNRLDHFEIRHTLRGGNKEADGLANEAMDRGMGRTPAPSLASARPSTGPAISSRTPSPAATASPQKRQVFEGFVKNGVVHILEGELPEGIFVKIVRE